MGIPCLQMDDLAEVNSSPQHACAYCTAAASEQVCPIELCPETDFKNGSAPTYIAYTNGSAQINIIVGWCSNYTACKTLLA